jgi:LPXTG-motif cell wall-anchored protein
MEIPMDVNTLIPSLALVTLGGVAAAAIGAMIYFLRRRRNREAASRALTE